MRVLVILACSSTIAAAAPAGNVLVPEDVELHPTKQAALAARPAATTGKPIAMRLVRDLGEVVELQTGEVTDCADSDQAPYRLTVYVRKLDLYGRIKTPIKQTFSDGTVIVLDRGAPVHGLEWAKRPVQPSNVAIAVPGAVGKAELPRAGTELVCDGGPPMTLDEWMAKQRARAKPAPKPAPAPVDDATRFADLLTQESPPLPPSCGLRDNILPTIDGKTVVWPMPNVFPAGVTKAGDAYFADVHLWCGRARMKIEKDSIGHGGSGGASLAGMGGKRTRWTPKRGKVTWPDGKPAGTFLGGASYEDVVEMDDRICVHVPSVAEMVCHAKRGAKRD